MRLAPIAVLAVIAALGFGYYRYRYPYGASHCCDKVLAFALRHYADEHEGWFPRGEATPEASLFVSGTYYDEERGNGTPLQFNRTGYGAVAVGGRLGTVADGEWRLTLFADDQKFRSTFSTQAADRNSETLALDQRVPTTSAGSSLQWSRRFGEHLVGAGGDARWVSGETNEIVYNAGVFARTREAGGEQFIAGVFLQDVYTPHPAWEISGGLRGDYWLSWNGTRQDIPPAAGVPRSQTFNDIERIIPSARLATLFHATPTTDLRASAYQGFRVPTVNEQYRVFRVRNDVTVANATLRPELLVGGELGVQQRLGPFEGRVTGYWNEVQNLVANVTLATPLFDCPAGTTCRQRQNLDLARIRGVETELELRRSARSGASSPAISSPTRASSRPRSSRAWRASASRRSRSTAPRWVSASSTPGGSTPRSPHASWAISTRTTSTRCRSGTTSWWTSCCRGRSARTSRSSPASRTCSIRPTRPAGRARASSRSARRCSRAPASAWASERPARHGGRSAEDQACADRAHRPRSRARPAGLHALRADAG